MTTTNFGARVAQIALDWYRLGVREGTPEGDAIISELLGRTDWPRNAWCGLTVGAWYKLAGLDRNLASVGKALFGFGYGNRTVRGGKTKAFDTYTDAGAKYAAQRLVTGDLTQAQRGDIILHQAKPGAYTGHVMLCLDGAESGALTTIEGNGKGHLYLPGLPIGEGICVRRWRCDDPYLSWVIRPATAELEVANV